MSTWPGKLLGGWWEIKIDKRTLVYVKPSKQVVFDSPKKEYPKKRFTDNHVVHF
jgi:hypothetical protein